MSDFNYKGNASEGKILNSYNDYTRGFNVNSISSNYLVAAGYLDGYEYIDKFGENKDIDTGTIPEDVWSRGGLYTFTVSTGADYYSSSSNNTDTQSIKYYVLTVDASGNWNKETITQALVGQTKTKLITPSGDKCVRIYRIENMGTTDLAGILAVYEDDTVVAGVPQTESKVRGEIQDGNNQTLMCIYTIPTGYVGFLQGGEFGMSRDTSSGNVDGSLRTRTYGGVFKIKKKIALMAAGNSIYYSTRAFPSVLPAKTDILIRVDSVSASNVGVFANLDIMLAEEGKFSDTFLTAIGQVKRI